MNIESLISRQGGVRKVADSILLTVFITMLVLYVIIAVIQR